MIPDPDPDFLSIPDPEVKMAPDPGSRIPDPDWQHCEDSKRECHPFPVWNEE